MKLVIGLIGRMGSGKTAASDFLSKEYRADKRKYSTILADLLKRLHLPVDRKNLQKMGEIIRKVFGKDVIVHAFEEDLKKSDSDTLVIDGIRYPNEVKMLRRFDKNILLFVHAPAELRYKRIKRRGEKGESQMTYEEFLEAESAETERHIEEIRPNADYIIDNSGTVEELYENLKKIMEREL